MVRSHSVMVWSDYLPKKSLVGGGGGGGGGEWQTKFNYSPGPGLWSLVLGPFGPDLGPDLGPGPGPELDKKDFLLWTVRRDHTMLRKLRMGNENISSNCTA